MFINPNMVKFVVGEPEYEDEDISVGVFIHELDKDEPADQITYYFEKEDVEEKMMMGLADVIELEAALKDFISGPHFDNDDTLSQVIFHDNNMRSKLREYALTECSRKYPNLLRS